MNDIRHKTNWNSVERQLKSVHKYSKFKLTYFDGLNMNWLIVWHLFEAFSLTNAYYFWILLFMDMDSEVILAFNESVRNNHLIPWQIEDPSATIWRINSMRWIWLKAGLELGWNIQTKLFSICSYLFFSLVSVILLGNFSFES